MDELSILASGLNLTAIQRAQLLQNLTTLKNERLLELNEVAASAEEGLEVTRAGFLLLAKALAGKQLTFTRVVFGDSIVNNQLVEVGEDDIFERTAMVNEKMSLPIINVQVLGGGLASVTCLVQNANLVRGFTIREKGLFARDPDTGDEILYSYANSDLKCKWIPSGESSTIWNFELAVITVIDSASNINAVIDSGLLYITREEFQQHVNSATPHPNAATGGGDIDSATVQLLNSRISQNEVNIANLFMQLDAETALGLKPNLLLVEDFKGESVCDNFVRQVTAATAHTNNITLTDGEGILAGSWYTLTDGVNSEFVQVVSVATSGDTVTAMLASNITKTYKIANTKLYRSTITIGDGEAYGAGDILSETFTYTRVWSGVVANNSTTIELVTTLANKTAFELDGDWAFTSDGEFTLAS